MPLNIPPYSLALTSQRAGLVLPILILVLSFWTTEEEWYRSSHRVSQLKQSGREVKEKKKFRLFGRKEAERPVGA